MKAKMDVLMGCGCRAQARHGKDRKPVCVVHFGLDPGAEVIAEAPDLTGRIARCSYGAHADVPSSLSLAFFTYHPEQDMDRYYCGCYGWD